MPVALQGKLSQHIPGRGKKIPLRNPENRFSPVIKCKHSALFRYLQIGLWISSYIKVVMVKQLLFQ